MRPVGLPGEVGQDYPVPTDFAHVIPPQGRPGASMVMWYKIGDMRWAEPLRRLVGF